MKEISEDLWKLATWEGSRREQLRRALRLTVRQRLQAAEELSELASRFKEMRLSGKFKKASD